MPPFIAFAASSTSGTNRMPSRKSIPTIRMPSTSASFSTRVGGPPAAEQDVRALDDLVGQAVVEVVVHLLRPARRRAAPTDPSLFVAHRVLLSVPQCLQAFALGVDSSGSAATVAACRSPKYSTSTGVPSRPRSGRR